jgi:hypothetical protein
MPSTATTRLRLEKQATGENLNTWGTRLNTVEDLIEFAVAGRVALTVSGAVSLTANLFVADQARGAFLDCTGTGGTVTIPGVEKLYLVRNATSADVVFTTGGATNATVKSGNVQWVTCDATNVYLVRERDLGADLLSTSSDPTAAVHLARKAYIDALIAAEQTTRSTNDAATLALAKAYADTLALAASSGAFPTAVSHNWQALGAINGVLTWLPLASPDLSSSGII